MQFFRIAIAYSRATSYLKNQPGLKKAGPFAGHSVEEKYADTVPDGR